MVLDTYKSTITIASWLAIVAIVVFLLYDRRQAVPQYPVNPDGTKALAIDNSKLLIAIGFGQKPNGHVDPIKLDAQGYVLCAPAPASPMPTPTPVQGAKP